ncbi:hypothetical protein M422DRAFT_215300, partial [Sphaerobolus stellatus SS14]
EIYQGNNGPWVGIYRVREHKDRGLRRCGLGPGQERSSFTNRIRVYTRRCHHQLEFQEAVVHGTIKHRSGIHGRRARCKGSFVVENVYERVRIRTGLTHPPLCRQPICHRSSEELRVPQSDEAHRHSLSLYKGKRRGRRDRVGLHTYGGSSRGHTHEGIVEGQVGQVHRQNGVEED